MRGKRLLEGERAAAPDEARKPCHIKVSGDLGQHPVVSEGRAGSSLETWGGQGWGQG